MSKVKSKQDNDSQAPAAGDAASDGPPVLGKLPATPPAPAADLPPGVTFVNIAVPIYTGELDRYTAGGSMHLDMQFTGAGVQGIARVQEAQRLMLEGATSELDPVLRDSCLAKASRASAVRAIAQAVADALAQPRCR